MHGGTDGSHMRRRDQLCIRKRLNEVSICSSPKHKGEPPGLGCDYIAEKEGYGEWDAQQGIGHQGQARGGFTAPRPGTRD